MKIKRKQYNAMNEYMTHLEKTNQEFWEKLVELTLNPGSNESAKIKHDVRAKAHEDKTKECKFGFDLGEPVAIIFPAG